MFTFYVNPIENIAGEYFKCLPFTKESRAIIVCVCIKDLFVKCSKIYSSLDAAPLVALK